MGITLTTDQIVTMAPDSSSAAAGKKLGSAKHWQHIGQNNEALWGECQGSALYQVRVELSSWAIQCSCPSRKLPCKHGLGLLLLAVSTAIAITEPPEWVTAWLEKRAATSKRKESRAAQEEKPASEKSLTAQAKLAEKRLAQVTQGIERLDLWMNDLVRTGLGSVETQPTSFWEQQAARLVDAQASGLAGRLRAMAGLPNASPDWPAKLLSQLGQLALLTHAFHRIEQLDPALQEDVRALVGWNLTQEEVSARGEHVTDDWLILGQILDDDGSSRRQRTWLLGATTQRPALIQQFALNNTAFPETFPLGIRQRAELAYWPGAAQLRARMERRFPEVASVSDHLPAAATIEAFLDGVASLLARQPWQDRFLCTLHDALLLYHDDCWYIRDSAGAALPLVGDNYWRLFALTGGYTIDVAGEWDGQALKPLGVLVDGTYYVA